MGVAGGQMHVGASPRRLGRLVCACLLGTLALVAMPLASARAAAVYVDDGQLAIIDTDGARNVVDVVPDADGYFVLDQGAALEPRTGCAALSEAIVKCLLAEKLLVDAGPGDDVIALQDVTVPVEAHLDTGDDLIGLGSGPAQVDGAEGLDSIIGGSADDELSGGQDDDLIIGGGGDDTMSGNAGDDILGADGEEGGSDTLSGGAGADLISGDTGNDKLSGGAGQDVLVSGSGADDIRTGTGRDRVFGSSNDEMACDSNDEVRGGRHAGCGRLASDREVPTAWPPLSEDAGSAMAAGSAEEKGSAMAAVAAALIPVDVHRPGAARRVSVCIPARQDRLVNIRFGALRKPTSDFFGEPFERQVRTRHPVFEEVPGLLEDARGFVAIRAPRK